MKFKTTLYLSHRWLGIGMCLLIAMWFATGMVMMYVGFPELTRQERYAGLAEINPDAIQHSPVELMAGAPQDVSVEQLILTSVAARPLYLLKMPEEPWQGMYADTGLPVTSFTADAALASAVSFYRQSYPARRVQAHYLRILDMDQWTVSSALSAHRPLHLVSFDDQASTHLYVSSRTGQVVRDTTRRERIWNWLGANLHWIYPLQLRKHTKLWVNLIIILSILGLLTIVTGGIIGFLRLRFRRRYRGKSVTPYSGVSKYHHFLGLGSLVFMTTFMFSGLMSMAPWGLFDASSSFSEQVKRYQLNDDAVRSAPAYPSVAELQHLLGRKTNIAAKELYWHWVNGESHLTLYRGDEAPGHALNGIGSETLEGNIQQRLGNLIPGATVVAQHRLDNYDSYYYSHHDRYRPLPILRVKFSDQEATWFHIDLSTGEVLGRLTYKGRVQRWLYNGLHSLDFITLINHRPLWDVLVLALCSTGLVFSVTAVVLGWRRLKKHINVA